MNSPDDDTNRIDEVWGNQQHADPVAPAALAADVAEAYRRDQRRLLWLNIQEIVPAIAVAVFLILSAPSAQRPFALYLAAAISLGVGAYLALTSLRQRRRDAGWGDSVRGQIERRLAQAEHRAKLYGSIAWWYLAPFVVAIILIRYGVGSPSNGPSNTVYFAGLAALTCVIYAVNRWYGRTRFEPEVIRLREILDDFDHPAS